MKSLVEQLLQSDLSAYKISKGSGVPYMTVNDLVNKKTNLDNAKYATVEKLYTFAKLVMPSQEK